MRTKLIELSMPYPDKFTCFEDPEFKLDMKFIWGEKTEVQSIEFNLENKTANTLYKINDVQKCPSGIFYRINLMADKSNPTNSSFIVNKTTLGSLDMRENHLVRFIFNCIASVELGEYEKFPCKFSQDNKSENIYPKSKDGTIILSI